MHAGIVWRWIRFVLCALAFVVSMKSVLVGCSPFNPIVIGPSPPIPLADPADYADIRTSMFEDSLEHETGGPLWRPVGVRRTDRGLAVDFLIEAEVDEDARAMASFFGHCFANRYNDPVWIEFRRSDMEIFTLEMGCATQVKRAPLLARVSPTFQWWAQDDSTHGHRYLTTALFHTDVRYESDTIEVRFNAVPQFGRMDPWQQDCAFSADAAMTDEIVTEPGQWMCFEVRDVKPWRMPW